jgi:DNA-binding SARP family transcriptional activator
MSQTIGATPSSRGSIQLLDGFRLTVSGRDIALPVQAQRVLAYLAVVRRPQPRQLLAERLWSDVPNERCQASLRTALWRIRQADHALVQSNRTTVDLDRDVQVDLYDTLDQAHRLLSGDAELVDIDLRAESLRADLLPDWDEDWVLIEREQLRQLRLHALEALSARERDAGRVAYAIHAAQAAIAGEPLRESARAALIEAYFAEGNVAEAHRELDRFSVLLWSELRVRPSASLRARVDEARAVTAT